MYLGLQVVALLTIKSRLIHKPSPFRFQDFAEPLSRPDMIITVAATFCLFLVLYLPFDYLVVEALAGSISRSDAQHLPIIINAAG